MSFNYLKTARILIIDDQPEEVLPIMLALSNLGIGFIYHKGDRVEDLPKEPFLGIRLVFLDLRLDIGGNTNQVLSKTVNVLKRLVDPNTMPLIVICWTKHPGDYEEFSKKATKHIPGLKPGFIKSFPKPGNLLVDQNKNNLIEDIQEIIGQYPAVQILWDWEQVVHEAVSDTTQTLADTVSKSTKDIDNEQFQEKWLNNLLEVLRTMVKAEIGQVVNESNAQRALFSVLNTLVSDRLNHKSIDRESSYSNKIIPKEDDKISGPQIASLNQMILFEPADEDENSVKPGNVYLPKNELNGACVHEICKFDFTAMGNEMIDVTKEKSKGKKLGKEEDKLKNEINKKPGDTNLREKLSGVIEEKKKLADDLLKKCKPILIEMTPPCDFLQKKRPVSRFIGGLLVPKHHEKILKNSPWIHKFDPSNIFGDEEIYILALSSRHQFGVSSPEQVIQNKPLCRIRSQALTDIRVWAAFQGARPGKLSIR